MIFARPHRLVHAAALVLAALPSLAGAQGAAVGRPQLIQDGDIAKAVPGGPHEGKGPSVTMPFSMTVGLEHLYFSKRILHPGATVGRHLIDVHEVYYLVEGEAEIIDDAGSRLVKPGTAMVLTPGQTVELRQRGAKDAVMIIANSH